MLVKLRIWGAIEFLRYAVAAYRDYKKDFQADENSRLKFQVLMQVHVLEKAMTISNKKSLSGVNYKDLIQKVQTLIKNGVSEKDFAVADSLAIMKSALEFLGGHDDEINAIDKINYPKIFKGGIDENSSEIIKIYPEWGEMVRNRHSIRTFKNKIIPAETVYKILDDAKYCPSACNRQMCKIYFSDEPEKVQKILNFIPDQFVVKDNIFDALVVTCDRSLLGSAELNDQEFINSGIFLGYLVMSIHAHGLGSCLFQMLQRNTRGAEKIRKALNIPDSEIIACFIGFGEPEEKFVTACAARRETKDIAIKL